MNGLEIIDYTGKGYESSFFFEKWRIGILNYDDEYKKGNTPFLEKHNETDEVFILVEGEATMLLGDNAEEIELEKNKLYVVKKGIWHNVYMTEDAKIIIVENADTSEKNSEYCQYNK